MFTTLPMQEAVIDALARRLAGTGTIVSGTEPNDYDRMTAWLGGDDAGHARGRSDASTSTSTTATIPPACNRLSRRSANRSG